MPLQRIAIIGGGISGLTAAYTLEQARRAGASVEYRLFEASERLGGVIRSDRISSAEGEFLVECGPDSFLSSKPEAIELCHELGLAQQLIGSNDAERQTYIYSGDRLVPLPDGLQFMVPTQPVATALSPLFSFGTKLRFMREYFSPPVASTAADESVADFVTRHFGREVVDRLADPLLSGIYGGTADALSVNSVLPQFIAMEKKHGSLVRAALANRKNPQTSGSQTFTSLFTTLAGGLEQIVIRLAERLDPKKLACNVPVQAIQRVSTGWLLRTPQALEPFDAIILALPAPHAGQLISKAVPTLADSLQEVRYSSSAIVVFGFEAKQNVAARLPNGFGLLAPRSAGTRMRAMTFVHKKFAGRAPAGAALLRMFYGGTTDESAVSLEPTALLALARKEMQIVVGIATEPTFGRSYRWHTAMAQYEVGHAARIAAIVQRLSTLEGIQFCGNALNGIGISDCIRSGRAAAKALLVNNGPGA